MILQIGHIEPIDDEAFRTIFNFFVNTDFRTTKSGTLQYHSIWKTQGFSDNFLGVEQFERPNTKIFTLIAPLSFLKGDDDTLHPSERHLKRLKRMNHKLLVAMHYPSIPGLSGKKTLVNPSFLAASADVLPIHAAFPFHSTPFCFINAIHALDA